MHPSKGPVDKRNISSVRVNVELEDESRGRAVLLTTNATVGDGEHKCLFHGKLHCRACVFAGAHSDSHPALATGREADSQPDSLPATGGLFTFRACSTCPYTPDGTTQ